MNIITKNKVTMKIGTRSGEKTKNKDILAKFVSLRVKRRMNTKPKNPIFIGILICICFLFLSILPG